MKPSFAQLLKGIGLAAVLVASAHTQAAIVSVNETIASSLLPAADNNPFNFNFTGLPTTPLTDAVLRITGFGDVDGFGENFTVTVDGTPFGTFGPFGSFAFDVPLTIPQSTLEPMLADGTLLVVLNFSSNVNTPIPGDFVAANLTYRASTNVPEPGSFALVGLALAGAMVARGRRT